MLPSSAKTMQEVDKAAVQELLLMQVALVMDVKLFNMDQGAPLSS